MTFGSLFTGIGGMDLGLERAGMECKWQVEIEPSAVRLLEERWPNVRKYGDITTVESAELEPVDLLAGGFPCQDVSFAGLGAGLSGARSGLWFHMLRIVRDLRPKYVLVENVSALFIRGFGRVLADLAEVGYSAEWDSLQAGYFGAPHERERVFILAYPNKEHGEAGLGPESNRPRPIFAGSDCESFPIWLQAANQFIGMDDGVPAKVYQACVSGIGNAVVPQVAEWIGRRIIEESSR